MIKYSEMLKEVIDFYPEEVACDDAYPIGKEGMSWQNLHTAYDNIEEENNYFEESNELLGVLLWSALVGINEGFRKVYVENKKLRKDKPCTKVSLRKIIDLDETLEHFLDSIENTEEWQDYLKEINEEILFDEVNKSDLI